MKLQQWDMSPLGVDGFLGEEVSTLAFDSSHWISATVPATSVSHLAEAGVIDDPYYGSNMKEIAGYKKEADTHFAFHPMPLDSPFRTPFWYRTTFDIENLGKRTWIKFHGLNFKGEIWVNGKRVAGQTEIAGSYRIYDLDITPFAKNGTNSVAVLLYPQAPDDLGITFIDWSVTPPDESAGIWQPVEVYTTEKVALKHLSVQTELSHSMDSVVLTSLVELHHQAPVVYGFEGRVVRSETFEGELKVSVSFGGEALKTSHKKVSLLASDTCLIRQSIALDFPQLWWPYELGEQPLYEACFELIDDNGECIAMENVTFGIREITSEINSFGAREFKVNGQSFLVKGSAWSPDLMLRQSERRDEIDIAYLKDMGLNTVRLEGKLATNYFWDLCDREGIIVMAGWPCCTHWEQWDKWKPDDYTVAAQSLKSQLLRLRNHASFGVWFYGSDYPPVPKVEKIYLDILAEIAPKVVALSSAAKFCSKVSGDTGVKMSGPYGYVPPSYWYDKNMPGVATSFNTETGPDASFPRLESIERMLPEDEQYVGSPSWNHHAGLASFLTTDVMNSGIEQRYGVKKENFEQFIDVAQIVAYESWRAMYEAYGRNFPEGTGVIGWMLNGHWPSLLWQKYDYWLVPTGGFYGTQKANEIHHVQYSYDDDSLWVINTTDTPIIGRVLARVFGVDGTLITTDEFEVLSAPHSRKKSGVLTHFKEELVFVDLRLLSIEGAEGSEEKELSHNFYWLSATKEQYESEQQKEWWYYRPVVKSPDFSPLQTLVKTSLGIVQHTVEHLNDTLESVEITNNGDMIAFGVQVDIVDGEGQLVAPVFWSENLLFLLQGECRTIFCTVNHRDFSGKYSVRVSCNNAVISH